MDSNIVLSYYEERTRDWRTRYVADIMHIKYAEHKIIKDYDLAIVRQKVDKLIEKWKEMDNKEKNTEFAHNKTLEIKKLNYKIKNILLDGLVQNIDVFQHYKNNAEEELAELDVSIKSTKSAISKLKKPSLPKACVKLENPTRPLQSDFVAKYTIIRKNAGTTERDGRNDAKRLCTNVVTVSDEVKPKKRKMQGKAEYSRRTVCKSLPKKM